MIVCFSSIVSSGFDCITLIISDDLRGDGICVVCGFWTRARATQKPKFICRRFLDEPQLS
jgi:hypothetical protein